MCSLSIFVTTAIVGLSIKKDLSLSSASVTNQSEPPNFDRADDQHRQALTFATKLGMRPLIAHCHLGLGDLSRSTAKREQTRDHLLIAKTMYREINMPFWLQKAEVKLLQLE